MFTRYDKKGASVEYRGCFRARTIHVRRSKQRARRIVNRRRARARFVSSTVYRNSRTRENPCQTRRIAVDPVKTDADDASATEERPARNHHRPRLVRSEWPDGDATVARDCAFRGSKRPIEHRSIELTQHLLMGSARPAGSSNAKLFDPFA